MCIVHFLNFIYENILSEQYITLYQHKTDAASHLFCRVRGLPITEKQYIYLYSKVI